MALSKIVKVKDTQTAEAVKITENVFRSVNIALVNELKLIYARMGIDIWEVIEAAKTKPFGYMPFYPGPGLGGHCIPIDPFYLSWRARAFDMDTKFIELAGEINRGMPQKVVTTLADALNERFAKSLKGSRILVLGVAYKRNIEDLRESPALRVIEQLLRFGAQVDYHDPYVEEIQPMHEHPSIGLRRSVPINAASLAGYDAVMIVTDHANVDYEMVTRNARLVVDTRNATKPVRAGRDNVVLG